jgi:hypothetical protein
VSLWSSIASRRGRGLEVDIAITLCLCSAILIFEALGWLIVVSALTWLAVLLLVFTPVPGARWRWSVASILIFAAVFIGLGAIPGFDDFNPLGHWTNAARIANGDWPVSNPLIPDLPLSYHWGIDAIAAFIKLPFGHRMSLGLSLAVAQTAVWVLQARLVFAVLGPFPATFGQWGLRACCTAAVVLGTQWVFSAAFPPSISTYFWIDSAVGGYRINDSMLAFGVHQRGFVLAFCFLAAASIMLRRFVATIDQPSALLPAGLLGALLAGINLAHAVVFGIAALSIALLCSIHGLAAIYRDRSIRQVTLLAMCALLIAAPGISAMTTTGMLSTGTGEVGRVLELAPFGFPRGGNDARGFLAYWAIWFGPLMASLLLIATKWRALRQMNFDTHLQLMTLAGLLSFFMLFQFDHPNKWDGSKFLIVGTFCITLVVASFLEFLYWSSPSSIVRMAIVLPLVANLASIGRQLAMFHQIFPADLKMAFYAQEPQPSGRAFSPQDALMIPDDTSHSRSVTWLASSLGMRQVVRYDHLYMFPIATARVRDHLETVDAALRLDPVALDRMGVKVITFTDLAATTAQQALVEQMGFARCGEVNAVARMWALWCRRAE